MTGLIIQSGRYLSLTLFLLILSILSGSEIIFGVTIASLTSSLREYILSKKVAPIGKKRFTSGKYRCTIIKILIRSLKKLLTMRFNTTAGTHAGLSNIFGISASFRRRCSKRLSLSIMFQNIGTLILSGKLVPNYGGKMGCPERSG